MPSFVEPQLAEMLLVGLRDLAVATAPPVAVVGVGLALGTALIVRFRRTMGKHGQPRRSPAAA